jgi:hypothetical protein
LARTLKESKALDERPTGEQAIRCDLPCPFSILGGPHGGRERNITVIAKNMSKKCKISCNEITADTVQGQSRGEPLFNWERYKSFGTHPGRLTWDMVGINREEGEEQSS